MLKSILKKEVLKEAVRIPTYANAVYLVDDHFILKIYDSKKEWRSAVLMYEVMAKHKLALPKIISRARSPPYILMAFLDGKQIREERTIQAYRSFGEWVGSLHNITFSKFGGLSEYGVGRFYEIHKGPFKTWKQMHLALVEYRMQGFERTILKPLIPKIRESFKKAQYPAFKPTLLHGDLNGKNVFVKNGKVIGVIDPDGGFVGCAEEELVRIELDHFKGNERLRKAFMQGYTKHARLLSGYEERKQLFKLSRTLVEAWCIIHLKRYKIGRKKQASQKVYDDIFALVYGNA